LLITQDASVSPVRRSNPSAVTGPGAAIIRKQRTGNLERFLKVNEAFKVLSDPESARIDSSYKLKTAVPFLFLTKIPKA